VGDLTLALILASPWIVPPAITMWRIRRSRRLESHSPAVPTSAPLVSVIVPARNERHNIDACVRSILGGSWPNAELIIVDDRSTDGTSEAARAAACGDPRVRIVENPELPDGWFGKPWACATGSRHGRGAILCFTDADARHGPHLVARVVNAMTAGALDMMSVVGHQELGSFWERVVQPQVFWMLGSRYGGTDAINTSPRVRDKIANGQCIFVRRDAYDVVGGHGAVRHEVAEDMALAQTLFAAGKKTEVILGDDELTTRMYTSLPEIMAGWRKNVFAGGRGAMPWGRLGQIIFPAILVLFPLLTLLPPVVLAGAAFSVHAPAWLLAAAAIAVAAQLATWVAVYAWMRASIPYALLYPLGAAVVWLIVLQAIGRGSRVEWKGRAYVTSPRAPRTSR
jgi:hypothetical protein